MRLLSGLDACNAELQLDGIAVKPILPGGMATHPDDGDDVQTVIDHSIAAAAHAQDTIHVMLYSTEAREAAHERLLVERDLRQAIYNDEFELRYQPAIDVRAGRAVGAEMLIRWHHS